MNGDEQIKPKNQKEIEQRNGLLKRTKINLLESTIYYTLCDKSNRYIYFNYSLE
jgi:hypothetical protein